MPELQVPAGVWHSGGVEQVTSGYEHTPPLQVPLLSLQAFGAVLQVTPAQGSVTQLPLPSQVPFEQEVPAVALV